MKLLKLNSPDCIGIEINAISFMSLLRVLRALPDLKIINAKQHINDEAYVKFRYKDIEFEITTPLSDYCIEKPEDCPHAIFEEIVHHIKKFKVKWWHKLF